MQRSPGQQRRAEAPLRRQAYPYRRFATRLLWSTTAVGKEPEVEVELVSFEPCRPETGLGRWAATRSGHRSRRRGGPIDTDDNGRGRGAHPHSERRFHALAENALDVVMLTGGTIRYLSPSVERVLGYTPEEMVGTSTAEYVHPDDMERARGELQALLSKPGVHPAAVETRVRHKDGSWRHLEGMATSLLDDPAVEGLVFNQRDVTDRVRAEEEVTRLNRELEGRVAERTARLGAALSELALIFSPLVRQTTSLNCTD